MPDSFAVVCGATGNQGGAVVEALLRRGRFKVRALVRNPRKLVPDHLTLDTYLQMKGYDTRPLG